MVFGCPGVSDAHSKLGVQMKNRMIIQIDSSNSQIYYGVRFPGVSDAHSKSVVQMKQ